jgi:hypothetical protein
LQAGSSGPLLAARCRAAPRCPSGLAIPVARHPSKLSPRQKLCVASPRPIPSRRYRRCRLSVSTCRHAGSGRLHASARPQGLVPLPSPLLPPGVATWKLLVAPLGLFPQGVGLASSLTRTGVLGVRSVSSRWQSSCYAGPWSRPGAGRGPLSSAAGVGSPKSTEVDSSEPGGVRSRRPAEASFPSRCPGGVRSRMPAEANVLSRCPGGVRSRMPAEANVPSRCPVGSGPGDSPKLVSFLVARVRIALRVVLRRGRSAVLSAGAHQGSPWFPYQPRSVLGTGDDQVPGPSHPRAPGDGRRGSGSGGDHHCLLG